ncbi:MAG: hypothetical protein K8U03_23110 [Planctomycetia bacterium]|nr:hypothetical protein [Planctomycetia bacterium]
MPETPDLSTLAALFYPRDATASAVVAAAVPAAELGKFERVAAEDLPAGYRELLAHQSHMTVTMEKFHESKVDVEVLERRTDQRRYARKIRLRTRSDGRIVQFGIVRLNLDFLAPDVRELVLAEQTPLGRVLIEHGVLMQVRLIALWRIEPGPDMRRGLEIGACPVVYGRTAMIDFENAPAIELLEISAPLVE